MKVAPLRGRRLPLPGTRGLHWYPPRAGQYACRQLAFENLHIYTMSYALRCFSVCLRASIRTTRLEFQVAIQRDEQSSV